MKVLIVDDEPDSRKTLSFFLEKYCSEIELVGTASSALEGIQQIVSTEPDLVFLDVEMPGGTGFDLLNGFSERNFHVIFTTAHLHYAIQAIKANAIDFLLKPVDIDDLIAAVENVRKNIQEHQRQRHEELLSQINSKGIVRIPISYKNDYLFLELTDILSIKSDGSYTIISANSKHYTTSKNLKHYEKLLEGSRFVRASNSYIINLDKVVRYIRGEGGVIELENGTKIPASKARREHVKQWLGI